MKPARNLNASLNHSWGQQKKLRLYSWAGFMHRPGSCALLLPALFPSTLATATSIVQKEKSILKYFAIAFGTFHLRPLRALLLGKGRGGCGPAGKARSCQKGHASAGQTAGYVVTGPQKGLVSGLDDTLKQVTMFSVPLFRVFGQRISSSARMK